MRKTIQTTVLWQIKLKAEEIDKRLGRKMDDK